MTSLTQVKTNFTAGEISTRLLGRGDLRAYDNGALRLDNLFIHPTGGVTRRAGLYHIDTLPGGGRLAPFEFNTEQTYVLVFGDRVLRIYRDGVLRATLTDTPWQLSQLNQLSWTQSADTLLVVHPDLPPRKINRSDDTIWTITDWVFVTESGAERRPFYRFADPDVTLAASATTGSVTLTASAALFTPEHEGVRLVINKKQVTITSVASPTSATASVEQTLTGTAATKDWQEAAFSAARGWPVAVAFHQDRLVIGGSRDLPNRLWLSQSGDIWNFNTGTGLDDEAIEFAVLSDQVNAIRAVFSGRHLQVFTSGGEWMVTGDPLTPTTLQVRRQTRVGMPIDRIVLPVDVDGATLFCARNGREIREFLYTDVEQAYQANDLALLSKHLVTDPLCMVFDQKRRLLFIAMRDYSLATLTIYRSEQVAAWARMTSDGKFHSLAVAGDDVYALTERDGQFALEVFDETISTDSALTGTSLTPKTIWAGLDHLEGRLVSIKADDVVQSSQSVLSGRITLDTPASAVEIGLPFTHVIEALPPSLLTAVGSSRIYRIVEARFRIEDTAALRVDMGLGLRDIPLRRLNAETAFDTPPPFITGDIRVRAHGWQRDLSAAPWRIEQSVPLSFTLLSVTLELKAG